jgi:hypothetical protein
MVMSNCQLPTFMKEDSSQVTNTSPKPKRFAKMQ